MTQNQNPLPPGERRWERQGDQERWIFVGDDVRHFMLKAGDTYVELHGHTVHVYVGPTEVRDQAYPLGGRAGERPEHRSTDVLMTEPKTDSEAWDAMARMVRA